MPDGGTFPNYQNDPAGAIPVYIVGDSAGGVTPRAGSASAIAVGGTAVVLIAGPCAGGYVTNPPTAASQGIAATDIAENVYVDPVASPGSTDATGNGTTALLQPGQTFTVPALAPGTMLRANAATSGHKLTVVVW